MTSVCVLCRRKYNILYFCRCILNSCMWWKSLMSTTWLAALALWGTPLCSVFQLFFKKGNTYMILRRHSPAILKNQFFRPSVKISWSISNCRYGKWSACSFCHFPYPDFKIGQEIFTPGPKNWFFDNCRESLSGVSCRYWMAHIKLSSRQH